MQQSDAHSYWEFNHLGTNWVHPLYELPFTGGFPDRFNQAPDTFQDDEIGGFQSIVPGSGPAGSQNDPRVSGDNPSLPRDPDKFDGDVDAQREFRYRSIPSGFANEVYLHVDARRASFEPRSCSAPMPPRSPASTRMATASSPRWKEASIPRRMGSRTTRACSCRQRRSTGSP